MTLAIDTNVLVRLLVRDDETHDVAAQSFVDEAAAEESVLIVFGALLETERVLRGRYRLDKASIASAFTALLESADVAFEHPPTVEEAIYVWAQQPEADCADCLLAARTARFGRRQFRNSTLAPPGCPSRSCVCDCHSRVGRIGPESTLSVLCGTGWGVHEAP